MECEINPCKGGRRGASDRVLGDAAALSEAQSSDLLGEDSRENWHACMRHITRKNEAPHYFPSLLNQAREERVGMFLERPRADAQRKGPRQKLADFLRRRVGPFFRDKV